MFVKNTLSSLILTLNGNHGTLHLISRQVGYLSDHMRQTVEQIGHTAALVINNEEADVVRAEIQRQRQYVCLQRLTLAGTCRSGDQAMRAVIFFMNIQIPAAAARFLSDHGLHAVVSSIFTPFIQYI